MCIITWFYFTWTYFCPQSVSFDSLWTYQISPPQTQDIIMLQYMRDGEMLPKSKLWRCLKRLDFSQKNYFWIFVNLEDLQLIGNNKLNHNSRNYSLNDFIDSAYIFPTH